MPCKYCGNSWKGKFIVLAICMLIIIIILLIVIQVDENKISNLQHENDVLKGQIKDWSFKAVCYEPNYYGASANITYEIHSANYQNYLNHLNSFKELNNCEVIK